MASKIINISLPEELVKKVDAAAKREYSSRSDYIRASLVNKLRQDSLDEWGDPISEWTDSLDLRDKNGLGMPLEQFVNELKKSIESR